MVIKTLEDESLAGYHHALYLSDPAEDEADRLSEADMAAWAHAASTAARRVAVNNGGSADRIVEVPAAWSSGSGLRTPGQSLGPAADAILAALVPLLDKELRKPVPFDTVAAGPMLEEDAGQDAFVAALAARPLLGRAEVAHRIAAHARAGAPYPMAVVGAEGSGLTHLACHVIADLLGTLPEGGGLVATATGTGERSGLTSAGSTHTLGGAGSSAAGPQGARSGASSSAANLAPVPSSPPSVPASGSAVFPPAPSRGLAGGSSGSHANLATGGGGGSSALLPGRRHKEASLGGSGGSFVAPAMFPGAHGASSPTGFGGPGGSGGGGGGGAFPQTLARRKKPLVLFRLCGATPRSRQPVSVLASWLCALQRTLGSSAVQLAQRWASYHTQTVEALSALLRQSLAEVLRSQPVALLVDGYDPADPTLVAWLPAPLPAGLAVVSFTRSSPPAVWSASQGIALIHLSAVAGMFDAVLARTSRTLTAAQAAEMGALCAANPAGGFAVLLAAAVRHLRAWEEPPVLQPTPEVVLAAALGHMHPLAPWVLSLLGAARDGLAWGEIELIVGEDDAAAASAALEDLFDAGLVGPVPCSSHLLLRATVPLPPVLSAAAEASYASTRRANSMATSTATLNGGANAPQQGGGAKAFSLRAGAAAIALHFGLQRCLEIVRLGPAKERVVRGNARRAAEHWHAVALSGDADDLSLALTDLDATAGILVSPLGLHDTEAACAGALDRLRSQDLGLSLAANQLSLHRSLLGRARRQRGGIVGPREWFQTLAVTAPGSFHFEDLSEQAQQSYAKQKQKQNNKKN